ncbi:hypothetical protein HK101_006894 [Irineochytrium annulatum]|nr:hypothetical protein HK101_006894 [Irineochytrium annulatum]
MHIDTDSDEDGDATSVVDDGAQHRPSPPCPSLPPEVWTHILSLIPGLTTLRELALVSPLTSRVRDLTWRTPSFRARVLRRGARCLRRAFPELMGDCDGGSIGWGEGAGDNDDDAAWAMDGVSHGPNGTEVTVEVAGRPEVGKRVRMIRSFARATGSSALFATAPVTRLSVGNGSAGRSGGNGVASRSAPRVRAVSASSGRMANDGSMVGEWPSREVFNVKELVSVGLWGNGVVGKLHDCEEFGGGCGLDLGYGCDGRNNFTGELPRRIGDLVNLTELRLSQNHLFGEIPADICKLTKLTILSMQENELSGPLPPSLFTLSNVVLVNLSQNVLYGELSGSIAGLNSAAVINLSQNRLSGPLPPEIGSMVSLRTL